MKKVMVGVLIISVIAILTSKVETKRFEYYTFEGVYGTSDVCQTDDYGARCLINGRMAIVSQYSIIES